VRLAADFKLDPVRRRPSTAHP
jgi:hypothetical protein